MFVKPDGEKLKDIARLVDEGHIVPSIYKVFPLEKAREAHELVEKGQTRGKVILAVRNSSS
ncbi:MAG: zinc-binding dehydrogenase [Proteobacteria bacterium]|nr:zinc-binding dehydrogenase [Pseudomonadota bacterium]